jgi:hypothetical protein
MRYLALTFLAAGLASSAFASPSAFSSGQVTIGQFDQEWTVAGPGTSNVTTSASLIDMSIFPGNVYAANGGGSSWISFAPDGGASLPQGTVTGIYTYTTTVDFTGSTGVLSGHLFSDNAVVGVMVGNTNLGLGGLTTVAPDDSANWFSTGTNFTYNTGVLSGMQTVSFEVRNGVPGEVFNPDPTAFRTTLNVAPVPEPFTMTLLGSSALVGFLKVRRRNKSV